MLFSDLKKKLTRKSQLSYKVQAERLELSHLAALDPKSSVSTNSTTPAFAPKGDANIKNSFYIQLTLFKKILLTDFVFLKEHKNN